MLCVRDVMSNEIEYVQPTDSVRQAAQRMRELEVGAIPIFDDGVAVGMLTDRDIAVRTVAAGLDPDNTRADEVATAGLLYCKQDDGLEDTARLMNEMHVRRLLVVDEGYHPVGIVSFSDMLYKLAPGLCPEAQRSPGGEDRSNEGRRS